MEEDKLEMCTCGAPLGGNGHCLHCKAHLALPLKASKKDKKDKKD